MRVTGIECPVCGKGPVARITCLAPHGQVSLFQCHLADYYLCLNCHQRLAVFPHLGKKEIKYGHPVKTG
jgi:hypothetical protein